MKRVAIVLTLFCFIAAVNPVQAQLSKKEKKEWKKKLKKMSPEQLKRMYDENASLKSELSSVQGQLSSIQAKLSEKDAKIAELTEQLREAEAQVNTAKRAVAQAQREAEEAKSQTKGTGSAAGSTVSEEGVVFKVQIGAFRNKDLSKYFENHENFGGEVTDDGVQKITLGIFRDYWEADTFKKYLREMGVNDAWIVPYKDGTRVDMKDVLEGVI